MLGMASNNCTATPALDNTSAAIKPVGPAPTTTTFFITDTHISIKINSAKQVCATAPACKHHPGLRQQQAERDAPFRFLSQFPHFILFKPSIFRKNHGQ
jgi:hypothetical protein